MSDYHNFLPESYTAYREKIGLGSGSSDFLAEQTEVVLNWPYKDCVLEGKQTKETRTHEEIFHHQTLAADKIQRLFAPKVFTNWERHDRNGVHELGKLQTQDNLVIKGNNLIVLHSLKARFANRINLIYIDVPFNTKKDTFNYNDSFSHATWLTFMKNRLEIAKQLLAPDGTIFVHADWHEVHYLKVLMDELFGRDNFVNEIIWCYTGPGSPKMKQLNRKHDTILWYANDYNHYTFNKDQVRVPYASAYQSMRKSLNSGEGWTDDDVAKMRARGRVPDDWWSDIAVSARSPIDGEKRTGYPTEKPPKLLERIIKMASNPGDLVLDFFAGSGTTAYVAAQLNRKFIAVEQLNGGYRLMRKRLDASTNYVSCTLLNDAQDFCDRVQRATDDQISQLLDELKTAPFLLDDIDPAKLDLQEISALDLGMQKRLLLETVDENAFYVDYAEIDNPKNQINATDKKHNQAFYHLN